MTNISQFIPYIEWRSPGIRGSRSPRKVHLGGKKVDFSAITSFRQSPSKGVVVHAKTEIKAVEINILAGYFIKRFA